MTDFLEALLKQQEENEEEQMLLQTIRKAAHLQSDQLKNRSHDTQLSDVPTSAALSGQLVPADRQVAVAPSQGSEPVPVHYDPAAATMISASASPSQPLLDRVRRTYSAARLWQARTVRLSGSSFGAAGQLNAPFYGLTKQEPVIPGYAALVDTAFARDARRYDGPLRIL